MGDDGEREKKKKTLHGTSDYSPEVQKLLKGWKTQKWGPGYNEVLKAEGFDEPDPTGRQDVTWKIMHDDYGYEKPAHGCRLVGDITQRDQQYWQHQKHVKLRDKDGTEHAVFFYVDDPYEWSYDDMEVGGVMVIHSPRLHRFMDGQDGMRLDQEKMVGKLLKRPFTDTKRLDYANLMKDNGNRKFEEDKYEDAVEYYELALKYVQGSSWVDDTTGKQKEAARELELKCHINIASSALRLKNYEGCEDHCQKALLVKPQSAKAYYRMGQARLARGSDRLAVEALTKALQLAPGDKSVSVKSINDELQKAKGEKTAQKSVLKQMYTGFLGSKRQFGVRKGAQVFSGGLSSMKSIHNFRDFGGYRTVDGKKIRKYLLYRSSAPSLGPACDVNTLTQEYGVKTIIDMRTDGERRRDGPSHCQKYLEYFKKVTVTVDDNGNATRKSPDGDIKTVMEGAVRIEIDPVGKLFREKLLNDNRMMGLWCSLLRLCCQADRAYDIEMHHTMDETDSAGLMREILDECTGEISEILSICSDPSNYPVVLSCREGSEITALISLLILGCIGVPQDAIEEDFMKSASIPDEKRKAAFRYLASIGVDAKMGIVKLETVKVVLDFLNGRYGGIRGYLEYIGFDNEKQKALKLQLTSGDD